LEEDKLKKEFFGIIKNKVKDDDDEFNNFLYESHEISNENNKERTNEKYDLNLTKEEKRVFSPYCQIGKDKSNDIDYQIRFRKLFKEEKMIDSDHYNKKLKDIITIQRLFRKLRIKRKLYIGFEEPNYVVRIYEHEYDIYPNIICLNLQSQNTKHIKDFFAAIKQYNPHNFYYRKLERIS